MLSLSLDEAPSGSPASRLAAATRGVVFFATPHFGSRLASLGLKLRHVPGAAPAPAVHHLAPGPHLELLNRQLKALHDAGGWGWGRCCARRRPPWGGRRRPAQRVSAEARAQARASRGVIVQG